MLRKFVTLFLIALLVTVGGSIAFDAGGAYAGPPPALPGGALETELKFQPAMDYDKDGCYPTPAIGSDGKINLGLKPGGALNGNCRDESDLNNTNAYSRSECRNDWCAYMYGFYFEKDQKIAGIAGPAGGHRHDWEHVVVWVHNQTPEWVAVSQHGAYYWRNRKDIPWEGTHAKVVYHKDGGDTHVFRHAKNGDGDEPPENHHRKWQYPTLVGWDYFPPGIRDKLVNGNFVDATLDLKDPRFGEKIGSSKPGKGNGARPSEVPWGLRKGPSP
jgi:Necrosis inducing protein (NPP1)